MSGKLTDNLGRSSGLVKAGAGGGAITWCTTAKTGNFNAASGSGYLVNTSSTAFTATLPCSPTVGDQIAFVDFAGTFDTNKLTLGRNTKKIKSECKCGQVSTERGAVTIIYTGTAQGWITTSQANAETIALPSYITASGGNQPTATGCVVDTNYKVHRFTGTGPFNVTAVGNPAGSSVVDYLVVAGGGGGGQSEGGGGGGAGGYRESVPSPAAWTVSPIANPAGGLTATVQNYTITVGAGGATCTSPKGGSGTTSVFSTITSAGGGGGGGFDITGATGGSGGGGGGRSNTAGGAGNTPPTAPLPAQGFAGGNAKSPGTNPDLGGGGGGALAAGTQGGTSPNAPGAGPGGGGATTHITGSPVAYAGGGGGGKDADSPNSGSAGAGGAGGGGRGSSTDPGSPWAPSTAAGANTGGGGGGKGGGAYVGTAGGTGVVILRYKFQ